MKTETKKFDDSKFNRIISINLGLLNSEQLKRISELDINFHKGLRNSLKKGLIFGRFTILTVNSKKEYLLSEKLEDLSLLRDFIDFFNEFHLFKNSGVDAVFSDLDGHLEYLSKSKNVILTEKPKDENIYIEDLTENNLIGVRNDLFKCFIIRTNDKVSCFQAIMNVGYNSPDTKTAKKFKTIAGLLKKLNAREVVVFNERKDLFEWLSKD